MLIRKGKCLKILQPLTEIRLDQMVQEFLQKQLQKQVLNEKLHLTFGYNTATPSFSLQNKEKFKALPGEPIVCYI